MLLEWVEGHSKLSISAEYDTDSGGDRHVQLIASESILFPLILKSAGAPVELEELDDNAVSTLCLEAVVRAASAKLAN